MKVQIISREFIKPSIPTSPSLRNYKISLLDEFCPTMNVPLILYYPPNENCNIISKCQHLKNSLAKTLTDFYLLAGRYMKESRMVDCSDQGTEFVEAHVDGKLCELLGQGWSLKVHLLNDLLPLSFGAADEIQDPLLGVQVNMFDCGGLAIGLCISHRVSDMSTLNIFLCGWTNAARREEGVDPISPKFNSASFFPGQGVVGLPFGLSRAKEDVEVHKVVTKVFSFDKKAISRIRDMARLQDDSSKIVPTRVQSVFGLVGKAIIDMNATKPGHPRGFIGIQSVNIREITVPPLPKYQCGNLFTLATFRSVASESGINFHDFVDLLGDSVKRAAENCGKVLSKGEDGQMLLINPMVELGKSLSSPEVFVAGLFSSWCRFSFYEVDFGWGNPIWVSTANWPLKNSVILIDDKVGEGIEAWVSLDEKDMVKFEQDRNIRDIITMQGSISAP